ncbi:unnamed protein product [Angiostrongylus costaricensis]|uniref:Oxysterol-binding protein n=1 Tax=Angiostrongylus costaricensis TaxID=334426 RepID=A0A158PLR6_ANGCS|nr:unnamed protein product [Angiostrongylus costaricensis]
MEIVNHGTGDKCVVKFFPYSYFSREVPRKIYGVVRNPSGEPQLVVQGTWDAFVDMFKVVKTIRSGDKSKIETELEPKRIWTVNPPVSGAERMHNFTRLAIQLNEPEPGVAPTDSRLRPDQRLMEEGRWDEANRKKLELEEKQRAMRRKREAEMEKAMQNGLSYEEYQPKWFQKTQDELTGTLIHKYLGEYWEKKALGDWSNCPEIF